MASWASRFWPWLCLCWWNKRANIHTDTHIHTYTSIPPHVHTHIHTGLIRGLHVKPNCEIKDGILGLSTNQWGCSKLLDQSAIHIFCLPSLSQLFNLSIAAECYLRAFVFCSAFRSIKLPCSLSFCQLLAPCGPVGPEADSILSKQNITCM
jgi:hypothetical protein